MEHDNLGTFYLGREVDPERFEVTDQPLLYDASDLTTHAVILGMTGSGKTGLGIDLIEEAVLDGVPVLALDPKGDLGNLALLFPDLDAPSFEPWVDPRAAEQAGQSRAEYAQAQASAWRDGLARWGIAPERLRRLRDAAEVAIYTPGSSAGRPLSILRSFAAPDAAVRDDADLFADRLDTTATGLLTLLGGDADPLTSREHILLTTLLEHAWRAGRDLDLPALIRAVQDPPVRTLGVMDLDVVMPAKARTALALRLNNLLAAPGFSAWTQGEPLDVAALLHAASGRPRLSVLSVAHLAEAERMFFASLLLSEVIAWMRAQPGTGSLRALLYIDELFGYLPPTAAPPSKKPLLTLLKQARAYGLGIVLASQNPVDLDYKALSNAGTWFLGRLQTERDKARVIDGLRSAAPDAADPAVLDATLSALPKRTFLLHNVHDRRPALFQTRWAMSYLAGPLTRDQLHRLEVARPPSAPDAAPPPGRAPTAPSAGPTRPAPGPSPAPAAGPVPTRLLPADVPQLFAPAAGPSDGVRYLPFVAGLADVLYSSKTHGVEVERSVARVVEPVAGPEPVRWDDGRPVRFDPRDLSGGAPDGAALAALPDVAIDGDAVAAWDDAFRRWLRTEAPLRLLRSPEAGLTSTAGEPERDFRVRCAHALREARDRQREEVRRRYGSRMQTLERRMQRAEQSVEREAQQAQQRTLDAAISVGTAVLGSFLGRRTPSASRVGTAVRRVGRIQKESGDVRRAKDTAAQVETELTALQGELEAELATLSAPAPEALALEPVTVRARNADIRVRYVGVLWVPHRTAADGRQRPASDAIADVIEDGVGAAGPSERPQR